MNWLDKCLETFGSEEEFAAASKELKNAHMPYIAEDKQQLIQHYQVCKSFTRVIALCFVSIAVDCCAGVQIETNVGIIRRTFFTTNFNYDVTLFEFVFDW